jgi:hypothetical protein
MPRAVVRWRTPRITPYSWTRDILLQQNANQVTTAGRSIRALVRAEGASHWSHTMAPLIAPLTASHLAAAAALLAARHRADYRRALELPPIFEDPEATRPLIAAVLDQPGSAGVAAIEDGRVVGFLLAEAVMPPPAAFWAGFLRPRAMRIPYEGFAAAGPAALDLYWAMYAALAPRFVARACLAHYIEVQAGDADALEAWNSLGFGRDTTLAVRSTGPFEAAESGEGIAIYQAGPEDIDVVMRLIDGLGRHHATSPIFVPYPSETLPARASGPPAPGSRLVARHRQREPERCAAARARLRPNAPALHLH